MAIVLQDGFDHYIASLATAKGWDGNADSMQPGRFAGQAFRLSTNIQKAAVLPATYATLIAGVAIKASSITPSASYDILRLRAGATNTARLAITTGGKLAVLNSGGTVIATGTTTLTANAWFYIELKIFINGASGTCEVHLNGVTEIASTTGNFGSTNLDTVALVNGIATPPPIDFDDLVVRDTSYVSDSTPGDIDTYTMDDLAALTGTVYGVQTVAYARKDDAGTRQIAPVVRQAGTDYVGSTVTLGSTYQFFKQIYQQDPTSADWTITNVNADEFGVKEIA